MEGCKLQQHDTVMSVMLRGYRNGMADAIVNVAYCNFRLEDNGGSIAWRDRANV